MNAASPARDFAGPVRRFHFDRVFTTAPPAAAAISAEDLGHQLAALTAELDRQRADHDAELARVRSEAFAAGRQQAQADFNLALQTAITGLADQVALLIAGRAEAEDALAIAAGDLALAAAEHLAAHSLADDPAQAITAAVRRAVRDLGREDRLTVTVHPALVEPLGAALAGVAPGRLEIAADPALGPADAHVAWDSGGLELDAAARRAALVAALA